MVLRNILIAFGALALLAGIGIGVVWSIRPHVHLNTAKVAPPDGWLVAARVLPDGTLLRSTDILWEQPKAGTLSAGSIARSPSTETAFLGAVTRRSFVAGEPLVESALVKVGDAAFLAAVLAPGDIAVSIAVDGLQSVAGLVLPGDRVDLILTQNFGAASPDPARKSVGEIVLRNIRVVAVDQRLMTFAAKKAADPNTPTAAPKMPGSVTLEVTDEEAEHVLVALQLGKVQLAVRSLENPAAGRSSPDQVPPPIWAGDVSPALRMLHQPPMVGVQSQAPSGSTPGPQSQATLEVLRGSVSH